jgi:Tfp pilus assembly protein PilF
MFLKTLARALLAQPLQARRANRARALHQHALRQCADNDRDAALETLTRAIALDPRNAGVHATIGVILLQQRAAEAALDHLRIAHDTAPHDGDVLKLLVEALVQTGRPEKARMICEAAVRRDRSLFEAWAGLGMVYRRTHRSAQALKAYNEAIALRPADVEAITNRAIALQDLGRLDEAFAGYDAALALQPDFALARFHRALALLFKGDYASGWPDYEMRLVSGDRPPRAPQAPRWDGAALAGRSVLVHSEQGIGDEIMFASCLPQLIADAGRCTIECTPKLHGLFSRSFPSARVRAVESDDAAAALRRGQYDVEVPMGSLPLYYRRSAQAFPRHTGYLKADATLIDAWRARLHSLGPGPKIGISWRGGTPLSRVALRSIPLAQWAPVFAVPGARFVSLQYSDGAASEALALGRNAGIAVAHWQEAIDDYDETAALVSALDLTISVCTAVVHLAGALGRPVWVMAPQAAEWRYGDRGEAMPWYPSARIFRQELYGEWEPVLKRVAGELHALKRYSFGAR